MLFQKQKNKTVKLQGKQTDQWHRGEGYMDRQNIEDYQDSATMMDICHSRLSNSVQCTTAWTSSPLINCGICMTHAVLCQCRLINWKMLKMEEVVHVWG